MAASKWNIPKHELETLARCFLPDIQAFFESEEGRKEYEAWKEEQAKIKAQKTDKTAQSAKHGREQKFLAVWHLCLTIKVRIVKENDKSEPISNEEKVRICTTWCG